MYQSKHVVCPHSYVNSMLSLYISWQAIPQVSKSWEEKYGVWVNSFPLGQNGRHFPDDSFKHIFMNEKFFILIRISLKFVPTGPIDNKPALVQLMAWRRPGDKPLSEPMLTQFTASYMRYWGEMS